MLPPEALPSPRSLYQGGWDDSKKRVIDFGRCNKKQLHANLLKEGSIVVREGALDRHMFQERVRLVIGCGHRGTNQLATHTYT